MLVCVGSIYYGNLLLCGLLAHIWMTLVYVLCLQCLVYYPIQLKFDPIPISYLLCTIQFN
jgi:hypothetical protein